MPRLFIKDEKIIHGEDQELVKFKNDLIEGIIQGIKPLLLTNVNQPLDPEWVDTAEAKKILGYRSKTKMQKMRDSKAIVFSKFGRKIKYQRQSLLDFIEKNRR